ncbi:chlorophyllide reductase [Rhodopseudomonas sp. RCAM05734]|uniref:chlorophyllide reductase n=1 Tax=Rhodopseudomonas sp. RCAM05734 TaxID=3457549 RepID=UPI004043D00A
MRAFRVYTTCAAAIVLFNVPTARAASSTSQGKISVTQVQSMLDRAAANATARQVMMAYLAGVGETAGVLMDQAKGRSQASRLNCRRRLAIDEALVQAALARARTADNPGETPATPLIVGELLKRAECEIR